MMKYIGACGVAFALTLVGCDGHDQHEHQHPTAAPAAGKAQDPVCGMEVDPAATKFKSTSAGKDFAFCSATCKEKFDKNPTPYLMGYCECRTTMPKCDCAHCKALLAKKTPTESCPCHEEKEHKDHH